MARWRGRGTDLVTFDVVITSLLACVMTPMETVRLTGEFGVQTSAAAAASIAAAALPSLVDKEGCETAPARTACWRKAAAAVRFNNDFVFEKRRGRVLEDMTVLERTKNRTSTLQERWSR